MLVVAGGRVAVADDAVAEAFTRLCAHWESVREPRAWLYRTAFRLVVDQGRVEQRERASERLPEETAWDRVFSDELIDLLHLLTPEQRLAVFLAYHADMSATQIARLTDSSVVSVRLRLHRARKTLRQTLELREEGDRWLTGEMR